MWRCSLLVPSNDLNPEIHRFVAGARPCMPCTRALTRITVRSHSAGDDLDLVDPTFTIEFAKLALGIVIELSEFSG